MDNTSKKFDEFGNVVHLENSTGTFTEDIEYTADGRYIVRIKTKYPNGIVEVEQFNPRNRYNE